ncbi:hypothetical protein [Rhizobium sp. BR 315]|uniref:hypothetical protein n=1 Tax=Rhizobium sp. BR 315 TaxID=3040014 RepID=UPI003D34B38E
MPANRRLTIIGQMFRLDGGGASSGEIEMILEIVRGTTQDNLKPGATVWLSWSLSHNLTDDALKGRLFNCRAKQGRRRRPEPNWA